MGKPTPRPWPEPRAFRPPLGGPTRSGGAGGAVQLREEAQSGRFDPDAVEAVLASAGHVARRRVARPAGLTAREVEVLRLLALGLSGKQIAARLVISPRTARNHVEHIYAKTGLTGRAPASLFAVQHGLLPADEYVTDP